MQEAGAGLPPPGALLVGVKQQPEDRNRSAQGDPCVLSVPARMLSFSPLLLPFLL